MVDGKWNIGKLMQNKHIETCFSVGMTDKNGVDIYTDDIYYKIAGFKLKEYSSIEYQPQAKAHNHEYSKDYYLSCFIMRKRLDDSSRPTHNIVVKI